MENGLYFNLPEEDYHADKALSASGIKLILQSPMDFWTKTYGPDFLHDEPTKALDMGKAYHKILLEGQEAFTSEYCQVFEAPDNCLKTVEDLKSALDDVEIEYKKSARKQELIDLVVENTDHLVYDVFKDSYEQDNEGKTALPFKLWARLQFVKSLADNNETVSKCLTGGYPEVSCFWEEDGIKFKARYDKLKTQAIVDLKSYSGFKEIRRNIFGNMASYKYHIQATHYLESMRFAKQFAKEGRVFGEVDKDFLTKFCERETRDFYFVFVKTTGGPDIRSFKFSQEDTTGMYGAALGAIDQAKMTYKNYMETYGTDPWIHNGSIETMQDDDFPIWATE